MASKKPGSAPAVSAPAASASARSGSGELRRDLAGAASGREGGPATPAASAEAAPDIAAVFEVLLAEELGEVPAGQLHSYTIQLTDDLIDRISMRVIERLTKGPLSETMSRIVTEVSERLVREEIARVRASAEVKNR